MDKCVPPILAADSGHDLALSSNQRQPILWIGVAAITLSAVMSNATRVGPLGPEHEWRCSVSSSI
jgi:hypothetical protein